MSDGPHRSLPMRPWWRRLAERADKSAFGADEVAEALVVALDAECRNELTPAFLHGLQRAGAEPSLFGPLQSPLLGDLSRQESSGLARRVLDSVAVLSPSEAEDLNCLARAFENAIRGEAPRYLRQIEEHYLRKSSERRSCRERERLSEALTRADIRALAERMVGPSSGHAKARIPKKSGLDDGVRL